MDKSVETYDLLRVNQEEIRSPMSQATKEKNINRQIEFMKIKIIFKIYLFILIGG